MKLSIAEDPQPGPDHFCIFFFENYHLRRRSIWSIRFLIEKRTRTFDKWGKQSICFAG